MDDKKLNSIVRAMSDLKIDELSVKKLMLAIFEANPWLALELPNLLKAL
jgi:digeranylgeranylglycerophospholipid reductase